MKKCDAFDVQAIVREIRGKSSHIEKLLSA